MKYEHFLFTYQNQIVELDSIEDLPDFLKRRRRLNLVSWMDEDPDWKDKLSSLLNNVEIPVSHRASLGVNISNDLNMLDPRDIIRLKQEQANHTFTLEEVLAWYYRFIEHKRVINELVFFPRQAE